MRKVLLPLIAVALVCGCATPSQVTVFRTVPPQFSIVPAKVVAVVRGPDSPKELDRDEETFLDLFIGKLRSAGPYEVLDERKLAAVDWDAYLKTTRADTVLRITLGDCDLEYDEPCEATIDLIAPHGNPHGGALLGHAEIVGEAHGVLATRDEARDKAVQKLIDVFTPGFEGEPLALDDTAPSFAEGMKKIRRGDLPGARSLWAKTLQTTPDSAPLLYDLGAVSEAMREPNTAGPYYLKAAQLAPRKARYQDALEKLNDRLDDEEAAAMSPEARAAVVAEWKADQEKEIADRDAAILREAQARGAKMSAEAVVDPKSGVSWVHIPAGKFVMGCVPEDMQCDGNEVPNRDIAIIRPFDLASTATTNDQYQLCIDAGACRGASDASKKALPVVHVTWDQAEQFCAWTGGRLPWETEWEWAARGGIAGWTYPWGHTPSEGSFTKNGFGLDGMTGDVYQWMANWMEGGSQRVLRGGAITKTIPARLSARIGFPPDTVGDAIGFRCARDVQ